MRLVPKCLGSEIPATPPKPPPACTVAGPTTTSHSQCKPMHATTIEGTSRRAHCGYVAGGGGGAGDGAGHQGLLWRSRMTSLTISSTIFPPKSNLPKPSLSSSFNGLRISHFLPTRRPSLSSGRASSSVSVVMMAKRGEELKDIRAKSTEELNEEIVDLKGELFMLRLQRSARNEFKSSEFRLMRKRIARMLTVKRERELEEGINKRLSRKLDFKWKKSIVPRPPPSLKKLQEEEADAEAKKSA
ncbi:50S ribosomal protein L29- chloroplastic [Striga hermonthica]|uniref:Large ribosomal subunit protein uL29c n=1 Tax=Striga hermonthica TaxID=68872 RepID=A0A9N7NU92_STRHE|nr:50S ribosomal protein L29- chloroplastic [Striga hermonthica]